MPAYHAEELASGEDAAHAFRGKCTCCEWMHADVATTPVESVREFGLEELVGENVMQDWDKNTCLPKMEHLLTMDALLC